MENLDLFYRTFEAYKKEISADPESAKFCRISKRQSDIENESLNIIFSTVDIDESWVNAIEKGLPYIEKAIKEDRQFIRSDGDIVPIEKVKKIAWRCNIHFARNFYSYAVAYLWSRCSV